jgi:serine protease Do
MHKLQVPGQLMIQPPTAAANAKNSLFPSGGKLYLLAALALFPMGVLPSAHADRLAATRSAQSGAVTGLHGGSPKDIPPHAPGYLGILFGNLSSEQATLLHVKDGRGVEIVMVDHDGPAGKAGLRPHDVILSMNGQQVTSADELRQMIHDAGVGAATSLLILRGGSQVTVNTQLAYRGEVEREAAARIAPPDPADMDGTDGGSMDGDPVDPTLGAPGREPGFISQMIHTTPFTGMLVEAMQPQLAGFFGAPEGQGLLVESVVHGSPAERAGLRAGDVVLRVDAVGVKSTGEWARRLHASKGKPVALTVLRDRRERTVVLTPEFKHRSRLEWPAGLDSGGGSATFA